MNWGDVVQRRSVAAAGVYVALTRKCPLHCAHCSTESTMSSPEEDDNYYRDFIDTFTASEHPEIVWFTGGEPMLRPALVRELAIKSHAVGARTVLTTGLYFGRRGRIPNLFWPALEAMDFVTVSVDTWHEDEVPRAVAFDCFAEMLDHGLDLGIQATGTDVNDPYLSQLTEELEARFDRRIGVYVGLLKAVGRGEGVAEALGLSREATGEGPPQPQGCGGLSWPVFGFGGDATNACCNQEAVNSRPDHLRLVTNWPEMARSLRQDAVLKVINLVGPRVLAHELDGTTQPPMDYCGKCQSLSGRADLRTKAEEIIARPAWEIIEALANGMRDEIGDPTLGQKQYFEFTNWGT